MKPSPLKHYEVVGRKLPTDKDPRPSLYKMTIFAPNTVVAKSRFFYFFGKLRKVKPATGQILQVKEVFEKRPATIKNYGVWLRYDSRSGTHNMYREYRELNAAAAITAAYHDMAGRHRVRGRSIHIIDCKPVKAGETRRVNIKQFINSKIRFPLPHRTVKSKAKFVASRPQTFYG